jgi:phospholipid/cholesterol/gamma-HCH transport system substrate-binding protein
MSHRKIEVIVGAVTLLALSILITITANLKRSTLFSSKYRLDALFKDVKRLEEGAPVYVRGVVVGDVRKLSTSERPNFPVRVVLMLKKGTRLHKRAQARIISSGLVGETQMSIEDTSPTAPELNEGDEIYGVETMSLDDLIRQSPAVVGDLQDSMAALKAILTDERNRRAITELLESAGAATTKVDRLIGASLSDTTETIHEIRMATAKLNRLLTYADTTVTAFLRDLSLAGAKIHSTVDDIRTSGGLLVNRLNSAALRIDETAAKADRLLATAESILSENRTDAHRTIEGLTSASVHLGQILARIDQGQSPLGEVVLGPQAYADLSRSIAKLENSLDILRRWLDGLDRWWTGTGRDKHRLEIPYDRPSSTPLQKAK